MTSEPLGAGAWQPGSALFTPESGVFCSQLEAEMEEGHPSMPFPALKSEVQPGLRAENTGCLETCYLAQVVGHSELRRISPG